ncbi:thermonuclease family protein [Marinobacterium jannaschii]|uniref:thermonuclease family protein n=1 Tax=Marinobacterium jannaschii TaxID=64970 RepID=UPI001470BAE1|nr:thermonuclease family protein [Marinobacterium jannaschii]
MSAFFIACHPAQAERCPEPAATQRVTVSHVFDGDTVALKDGRRVRLIGINTPEVGRQGQPDQPYAVKARQRLQQLVRQGVLLQYGYDRKDRYGRVLANLYRPDGRSVVEILLREGLGFMVAIPPNLRLHSCLLAAEQDARTAVRGVWDSRLARPVAAAALRRGGYQRVSGQVSGLSKGSKGWFLVLDGQLTIRLSPELASSLSDKWRQRLSRGRKIVVSGWIIDRNHRKSSSSRSGKRWFLNLSHPSQLELQP